MRKLVAQRAGRVGLATAGVAVLALAASAGLTLASGSGTIKVCVAHHGGGLYKASHCARHDHSLSWNAQGPAGRNGSTGSNGTNGTNGVNGTNGQGPGYSAFNNATVTLTATDQDIATLQVPAAGSYAINAKLLAYGGTSSTSVVAQCTLTAGGDTDSSTAQIAGASGHIRSTVPLQVVHIFTGPGTAVVTCNDGGDSGQVLDTKITAVQLTSLTNTPVSH